MTDNEGSHFTIEVEKTKTVNSVVVEIATVFEAVLAAVLEQRE